MENIEFTVTKNGIVDQFGMTWFTYENGIGFNTLRVAVLQKLDFLILECTDLGKLEIQVCFGNTIETITLVMIPMIDILAKCNDLVKVGLVRDFILSEIQNHLKLKLLKI